MNSGYPHSDRLPYSEHDLDRQFLASLAAYSLRQLKTLAVALLREYAPGWQVVAVERAIRRAQGKRAP